MLPTEVLSWGEQLRRVTSVRHRNILLRVAHGEIYTREKLTRYHLRDDPSCPSCQEIETLAHKFVECNYVKEIWKHTFRILEVETEPSDIQENRIVGCYKNSSKLKLAVQAELLLRILSIKDNQTYLAHPKLVIKNSIELILRRERNEASKTELLALLDRL